MNISKYFMWSVLVIVNLTMGMILPVYSAGPNPDLTPTTTKSVSSTMITKAPIGNRHHHLNHHRHNRHNRHNRHHCYQHDACYKHHHKAQDMSRHSIRTI
jgi:hypothetical protein